MAEVLVVVSKIKKIVKDAGFRTGGDYVDALSAKIDAAVRASITKVQAEGKKKTLGAEDLA
jgi:phage-related protein